MQDLQPIIDNIQTICDNKGISVNKALQDSGAGRSFISSMRAGSAPSIFKIISLATYLNVPVDCLVKDAATEQSLAERALNAFLALPTDDRKAFIQEAVKHI